MRLYPITDLTTGAIGTTYVKEGYTATTTGRWELTVDTTNPAEQSPTGVYAVQIFNPSTNQVRYHMGDMQLQVGFLTGNNGALPFNDGSVTSAKIADAAITDAKIGSRTVNPSISSLSDTNTLLNFLSSFAKQIKALAGTSDWKSSPATTLAAAAAHALNTGNPHQVTPLQIGAVKNNGGSVQITSGLDSGKGTVGAAGYFYVATDTQMIYRHNGSSWVKIGVTSYNDLDDKPASTSQSLDFGRVAVGLSSAPATLVGDTITFAAGAGISIALNTQTKTITISASAGAGGSVPAHTHAGSDITSAAPDSDKLQNIFGGRYPYMQSYTNFATSGASLTSSVMKMVVGSQTIITNGSGTIGFQPGVTISNGIAAWFCSNGDYDAYAGDFVPQSAPTSFPASSPTFSAHATNTPFPPSGTTQRINYQIFYW